MAFERPIKCQLETRNLVWVLGISLVLVLLVENFELPYGYVMSSLLYSAKTRFNYWNKNDVNQVTILATNSSIKRTKQNNATGGSITGENVRVLAPLGLPLITGENGSVLAPLALPLITFSPGINDSRSVTPVVSLSYNSTTLDKNGVNPKLPQNGVSLPGNSSSVTNIPAAKRPMPEVVTVSEMRDMLLQNRASYLPTKPLYASASDQELVNAKLQIENAPLVTDDPDLYYPLYMNLSTFKRSYELMEQNLKVYIYKEGKRPVFHQSQLTGIYASEGWFLKLLERNKQYVTDNPKEAHLYYLPFTSQLLEKAIYVPNSHTFDKLIKYLKDYLDLIKTRHSFWNRTAGADHFLVACHDWAPEETKRDMVNCIRALCNADLKVGFELGKDVSLPETYMHSAENPSRGISGNPTSQRNTLAFFAGKMHGYLRPILLKHWQNKDPDMQIFGRLRRQNYAQLMKSSKYCICPRGYEVNSPRVVEAIMNGCVPVIISDNFVPPFLEVLNWEAFAVFVLEKDIPNLKKILLSISERRYIVMQYRVQKVRQHFVWHKVPEKYDIFHMILHSIWYNRVFQMHN